MHVQNDLQLIDSTETFEHSDPIGQNTYNTFFTEASTIKPNVHSNFHPTLTLDTNDDSINNSTGKKGTQAVSASATQSKQEAETLDTDNLNDWVLTPAGLFSSSQWTLYGTHYLLNIFKIFFILC